MKHSHDIFSEDIVNNFDAFSQRNLLNKMINYSSLILEYPSFIMYNSWNYERIGNKFMHVYDHVFILTFEISLFQ